jgi:hypothetical protein
MSTTNPGNDPRKDPLDVLLSEAFRQDIEQVGDADMAGRVMRTLKRRHRLRAAILGVSMAAGLSLATTLALPGLTDLLRLLADQAPIEPSSLGVLPIAALLAILTPWLFSLVDDRV